MSSFYFEGEDNRKKERVTLRLEANLFDKLKAEGSSISITIRKILQDFYERKNVK